MLEIAGWEEREVDGGGGTWRLPGDSLGRPGERRQAALRRERARQLLSITRESAQDYLQQMVRYDVMMDPNR